MEDARIDAIGHKMHFKAIEEEEERTVSIPIDLMCQQISNTSAKSSRIMNDGSFSCVDK